MWGSSGGSGAVAVASAAERGSPADTVCGSNHRRMETGAGQRRDLGIVRMEVGVVLMEHISIKGDGEVLM